MSAELRNAAEDYDCCTGPGPDNYVWEEAGVRPLLLNAILCPTYERRTLAAVGTPPARHRVSIDVTAHGLVSWRASLELLHL